MIRIFRVTNDSLEKCEICPKLTTKTLNSFVARLSDIICDALLDLVLFAQFKKRDKHPWRSVTFMKVAGLSL